MYLLLYSKITTALNSIFVFTLTQSLQEFQRELGQWRKDPGEKVAKKKPKYSYKTVEELKAHGKLTSKTMSRPAGELAQVKVREQQSNIQKTLHYSALQNIYNTPLLCFR